jgi:regulator of protease activity HflC (stomatin/prohibitin superfamily)
MLNDPTVQAMANEAAATIEAAANDPTVQAMADEAAATAEAMANDPTAQAMANEAMATAGAMAADPTVQAALDQAFSGTNNTVTLNQGQALALDTLSSVPGVTNWKMTLVDAPASAAANEGQVIKEASGGNISVNPDEYAKYFTTAGDYRVRLDLTTDAGAASQELTVTVP